MKISLTLKNKINKINVKPEPCHFRTTSKQNCKNNDSFLTGFKQTLPLSSIGHIHK